MSALVIAAISVIGTGVLSLVGSILLGKLVPAGQVAAKQAEIDAKAAEVDKWRLAYEEKTVALAKLEDVVERQKIVTETVNQVLAALKTTAQTPPSPQPQVGGSA